MNKKLIAIVGQTASGKTGMAVELAGKFNGEIICADSRTIYKEMDIGTAKPSTKHRSKIKHHLLDVIEPDKEFNAADFKKLTNKAISEITDKNKIPFLVGGTGLYVNAVVYDYRFGSKKNMQVREELEAMADDQLQDRARNLNIGENEINFKNKRHLIRAIERGGVIRGDDKLRNDTLIIGIEIGAEELKERIKKRIDAMLDAGLEKEAIGLANKYGFDSPGLNTICYKEWRPYFAGEQTFEELKQKLYADTWQYARRQKTWFKRDSNIKWVTSVSEASVLAQQFLIQ